MMTYARDVLQNLEFVCVDHVNNLFEVIQHDNDSSFEIIKILKNDGLGDKFDIGDIIALSGGMVEFGTTDSKKIECHPTVITKQKILYLMIMMSMNVS